MVELYMNRQYNTIQ